MFRMPNRVGKRDCNEIYMRQSREQAAETSSRANQAYEAMRGGLSWGVSRDQLVDSLEGLSADEVDALACEYHDHYGRDLIEDVQSELWPIAESQAMALIDSDQVGADAAALRRAMHGGTGLGAARRQIQDVLTQSDAAHLDAVATFYEGEYKVPLKTDLMRELSGDHEVQALARLNGESAKADAAALHYAMKGGWTGWGANFEDIKATLADKSPEELRAIEAAYGTMYGTGSNDPLLRTHLRSELGDGARGNEAIAMLDADEATARAAQAHYAMKGGMTGWGVNEDDVDAAFMGGHGEDIQAAYARDYGTHLDADLQVEISDPNRLAKASQLLETGELSLAEEVYHAAQDDDVDALRDLLEDADVVALRAAYKEKYGRSLDNDVMSTATGADVLDLDHLLRGPAKTPEEALARAQEKRDYERGGWLNGVSSAAMDLMAPEKGRILERDVQRAQEVLDGAEGRALTEVEQRDLDRAVGWVEQDVGTYRHSKEKVGETAGTVAATGAGLAVTVGTGGAGSAILLPMLKGAALGGGARVLTSGAISGRGYTASDLGRDFIAGAADGGATVAGSMLSRTATGGILSQQARQQLIRSGVANPTDDAIQATAKAMLEGSTPLRAGMRTVEGGIDATIGGAVGSGAYTAMEGETWEEGFGPGMAEVGKSAATGGVTAGLTGGLLSGGLGPLSRRADDLVPGDKGPPPPSRGAPEADDAPTTTKDADGATDAVDEVAAETAAATARVATQRGGRIPPDEAKAYLPNGEEIPPTTRNADVWHGNDIPPDEVIKNGGLGPKGTDTDLYRHTQKDPGDSSSAFRGSTLMPIGPPRPQGGVMGAANFGEFAYDIVGVPAWDIDRIFPRLDPTATGFAGGMRRIPGASEAGHIPVEAEHAIPGFIPLENIRGWVQFDDSGKSIRMGKYVDNPHYVGPPRQTK